jgi:PilZ domain
MPFTSRQSRRLPVCCSLTYHRGQAKGSGTVRNLSPSGYRFSGDLPLHIGETCSMTVTLPNQRSVYLVAGIVRWVRGKEYGIESLVVDHESREEITKFIGRRQVQNRLKLISLEVPFSKGGSSMVSCPTCSSDCYRSERHGWRDFFCRLLGLFPWRCRACRNRFYLRKR